MKNWMKRTTGAALALAMAAGLALPVLAQSDASRTKDENVFVTLASDGAVQKQTVSVWLHDDSGVANLADPTSLANPTDLKGALTPAVTAQGLVWNSADEDFYYQGTTGQTLPISVNITYAMDGQTMSADEILGKSGHFSMRISLTNTEFTSEIVNGRTRRVYTPYLCAAATLLDTDKYKNIQAENGTVQTDSGSTAVTFAMLPGMAETFDGLLTGKLEKLDGKLHDNCTLEADVTELELPAFYIACAASLEEMEELDDLQGDMDDLDADLDDLRDATDELIDGVQELYDGVWDDLTDGVNDLKDGSQELYDSVWGELSDGIDELKDGTRDLKNGVWDDLSDGVDDLKDGAKKLNDAAKEIDTNMGTLNAGLGQLSGNSAQLRAGTATAVNTIFASATAQINDTLKAMRLEDVTYGGQALGLSAPLLDAEKMDVTATREDAEGNSVHTCEDELKKLRLSTQGLLQDDAMTQYVRSQVALNLVQDAVQTSVESAARAAAEKSALEKTYALLMAGSGAASQSSASGGADADEAAGIKKAEQTVKPAGTAETATAENATPETAATPEGGEGTTGQTPEQPEATAENATDESGEQVKKVTDESGGKSTKEPEAQADKPTEKAGTQTKTEANAEPVSLAARHARVIPYTAVTALSRTQEMQIVLLGTAKASNQVSQTFDTVLTAIMTDPAYGYEAGIAQNVAAIMHVGTGADDPASFQSQAYDIAGKIVEAQSELEAQMKALVAEGGTIDSLEQLVTLYDGVVQYTNGVDSAAQGAAALKSQGTEVLVKEGTQKLVDQVNGKLTDGLHDLKDGTKELDDKVHGKLSDGIDDLKDGVKELNDGVQGDLNDGVNDLKDGTQELLDGVHEYNDDGISKLTDSADIDQLRDAADIAVLLKDKAQGHYAYTGTPENTECTTKFIMKVSVPEAPKVEEEVVDPNAGLNIFQLFIKRFKNLFGLD